MPSSPEDTLIALCLQLAPGSCSSVSIQLGHEVLAAFAGQQPVSEGVSWDLLCLVLGVGQGRERCPLTNTMT